MLVKTYGSAVHGVEAMKITIEVNWLSDSGKDASIVGLPDVAVKESLQRIESTFKTHDYDLPRTKIVVNMAPADIKKSGTAFDLPIALGILGASRQLPNAESLSAYVIMGELALDGNIRPIKGALPIAIQAVTCFLCSAFISKDEDGKKRRQAFLISGLLILLIGMPVCFFVGASTININ